MSKNNTVKSQNVTHKKKIAVIGGGFTGLTAAYELAKDGHLVAIYEATANLGGLASGFTLSDGTPLERAYHFLYTTDNYMIDMAKELGIEDKLHFYPSSIVAFYKGKRYPFTTAKDLLMFGPLSFVGRIRTGFTGLRLLLVKKWQPLTKITAYEWLCRVNGKRATDLVWKPLLVGKFDIYWDKITMAWLWTRIHVRQTSKIKGEQSERLGYFDGGFQTMVKRWHKELVQRGVAIHTETKIQSFDNVDGKPALIIDGKRHIFDAVIAAIPNEPFALLGSTHPGMTEGFRHQLQSIEYLAAVIMIFVTDRPITDSYWHQIHDENAPFLVLLSLDSLVGKEKINGHYVYYVGDYVTNDNELMSLSDDQIRERWFDGVHNLFPEFSASIVNESYVFKFRNAQHIVDTTYEERIPPIRTPLAGFYLSNFSQIFPEDRGTNYAVREGKKVADIVRKDIA